MKHWICWQQSNLEAATYIVAHRDDPALGCLVQWAEMYLARHPESSPVTPGSEAERQFELS